MTFPTLFLSALLVLIGATSTTPGGWNKLEIQGEAQS